MMTQLCLRKKKKKTLEVLASYLFEVDGRTGGVGVLQLIEGGRRDSRHAACKLASWGSERCGLVSEGKCANSTDADHSCTSGIGF